MPITPPVTDIESTVERTRADRVVAALLTLLALLIPGVIVLLGMGAPAASGAQAPPVTEADRQLLIKVRQAGLWEIPAGQQAQQQAASQVVKDVGATIAEQHIALDEEVRAVAQQLGVPLPNQPSKDQQGWLTEMSGKWGPEFDAAYANLLRDAHGKVFSVIAQVRAGTRNEVIRDFANKANEAVKTHLNLLESTELVDFEALPQPSLPAAAPAPATDASSHGQQHGVVEASAQSDTGGGGIDMGLVVAICFVEFVATVGLVRLFRTR